MATYSRRDFFKGALAGGAVLAVGGLAGCASADAAGSQEASHTYADTIAWNADYDVVVIGFGAAGAATSIYAADAGAKVLLCDVAPEGHEGGNSRYCGQIIGSTNDPDKLFEYYKSLAWKFEYDEEVLRVYTQGMGDMHTILRDFGLETWKDWEPEESQILPEYPGLPGGDAMRIITLNPKPFDSALWKWLRKSVMDRSDSISVWLESPAVHLMQEPQTGTVIGVEIDKQGEKTLVRARNGVVLTCGGFENNPRMQQDYLGAVRLAPLGSTYNKGDGVRMGLEAGADLWHMNSWESLGILSGNAWRVDEGAQAMFETPTVDGKPLYTSSGLYGSGSVILVGDNGDRFLREDEHHRHGHVPYCGVYRVPTPTSTPYLVFDEAQYADMEAKGYFDEAKNQKLISASSIEELAAKLEMDPAVLGKTVENFNAFAEGGVDYAFGRDAESMRPLSGGTYYAAPFGPVVLNTQGGPRRNAAAQVVDPKGDPIPHLYSAGECGGVTAFHYNGGGNIAECLVFGRIAGREAAKEKDPLPALAVADRVEPDLSYAVGKGDYAADGGGEPSVALKEGEYLGTNADGIGGEISVKVSMDGSSIRAVEVVKQAETPDIGGKALEQLTAAVVEKGSADVDAISGATITSNAFKAAVEDALSQAK